MDDVLAENGESFGVTAHRMDGICHRVTMVVGPPCKWDIACSIHVGGSRRSALEIFVRKAERTKDNPPRRPAV